MKNLLIIIPCFNEQAALPGLLQQLINLVLPKDYQMDIVVINDHSTDLTADVASKFPVTLLNLPVNLGIGGAVQCGLRYAMEYHYDLAVQMDGDGQHPPSELPKLLSCYQLTGANLVIGSRFLERQGFQSSPIRRLGISYFHLLNKVFTGQNIYDSTSGFRLFDQKSIQLAARHYPDDYPEPESLVMFSRKKLSICETAVLMKSRDGGKSSIGSFASLFYCVKVSIAMSFSAIRSLN
ncbi:MAG: glycosyltransferase family 2 protein [Chryseobacterium sp.]|nr:MAG: glycosyltransferase family 2 protein [Chryseobacterium sp.]